MSDLPEFECGCEKCIAMCKRFPCRPLPHEVAAMPDAAAARLMIKEADGDYSFPYLQAAGVGHEGQHAPDFDACFGHVGNPQQCTFQSEQGLCELHGTCKPWEGRVTVCGADRGANGMDVNDHLEQEWKSDRGQRVLREWREDHLEPARTEA